MTGAVWSRGAGTDGRVDVRDRGFLLGDGIFDTLVAFHGVPFAGELHLRRLVGQAESIGIVIDERAIREGWADVLARIDAPAIVRTTVTRGRAPRGLWPAATGEPTIVVTASPWSRDLLGRPVRLATGTIRRNEHAPTSTLKSLAYLDNILAAREAAEKGADDALLLNTSGAVACTTIANLFAVRDGRLLAPRIADGVLPGVLRALVLEGAPAAGLEPAEVTLSYDDVLHAEAAFLTNSVRFLQPVLALDGRPLGDPDDPRLAALAAALARRVRAECGYDLGGP